MLFDKSMYSLIWEFFGIFRQLQGILFKNPIKNSYHYGLGRTTQTLDHVVVVHKYFEAGVHIKNPIKNSYQLEDGLGRTTKTLDHVLLVHILI